ncbi:MAG: hypothetical protein VX899_20520 [Myxococcota bacterium]|nr:hypothetical protein [Myxococcota bacterium]
MSIKGIEGMSDADIQNEVAKGGRFVVFPYAISILIMTFYRKSDVHFIKADESAFGKAFPYILLSGVMGWWGLPWGLIRTPQALFHCFSGGEDVTDEVFH